MGLVGEFLDIELNCYRCCLHGIFYFFTGIYGQPYNFDMRAVQKVKYRRLST